MPDIQMTVDRRYGSRGQEKVMATYEDIVPILGQADARGDHNPLDASDESFPSFAPHGAYQFSLQPTPPISNPTSRSDTSRLAFIFQALTSHSEPHARRNTDRQDVLPLPRNFPVAIAAV